MREYHELLKTVLTYGEERNDRTGTGTISLFGSQMRVDLSEGFPLLTTKKVFFKGVLTELLWFISGDTNVRYLQDRGVHIWDEWADENGDLGPVYGKQWRLWQGLDGWDIDQLQGAIDMIREDPNSRRNVVTAWNPSEVPEMALPPCHALFQFYVHDGKLSCHMYQRSADAFLGLPFNVASYALLTQMIAWISGLRYGHLIISFGDLHVYQNHLDQVVELLGREPRPLPKIEFQRTPLAIGTIDAFTADDVKLVGYDPYPAITAPVAV